MVFKAVNLGDESGISFLGNKGFNVRSISESLKNSFKNFNLTESLGNIKNQLTNLLSDPSSIKESLSKSFKTAFVDMPTKTFSNLKDSIGKSLISENDVNTAKKYWKMMDEGAGEARIKQFDWGDTSEQFQSIIQGAESVDDAMVQMGASCLKARIGMLAAQAGAVALNAALTLGITALVSWGVSAIDNFIHRAERIKDAAINAKSAISDIHSELSNKSQIVENYGEKFAELSKGVDSLTGKNKSLSSESYQEYLDISNKLAEAFPSLSRIYDENGNAIVNLGGNAESATSQLQSLLDVERQLANEKITDNFDDVFAGAKLENSNIQSQLTQARNDLIDFQKEAAKTSQSFRWDKNTFKIDENAFKGSDGLVDNNAVSEFKSQVKKGLDKLGVAYEESMDGSEFLLDWGRMTETARQKQRAEIDAYFANTINDYQSKIGEYQSKIKSLEQENANNWSNVIDNYMKKLSTDGNFTSMSDSMQAAVQNMVGHIDFSAKQFQDQGEIDAYVNSNIIDPIKNLSSESQDALAGLFSLDTSKLSVDDYYKAIKSGVDSIVSDPKFQGDAKEFRELLGFEDIAKDYRRAAKEIEGFNLEGFSRAKLGQFSADETLHALDLIRERGITTWQELEDLFNSGVLSPSINMEAETEAIKGINEALANSNSATGMTAENINAIYSRYKDLDGFDASKVFQRTTTGVHANAKAVRELEDQYNKLQRSNEQAKLDDQIKQYDDLTQKIKECTDAKELADLYNQRNSLLNQINDTADLIAQYDGLTSAYNKWQEAQAAGNARDKYENMGEGYKSAKEALDLGWYGDASLNEYLDLMLGSDRVKQIGDVEKAFNSLTSNIGDTGYSIMDFWSYDDATGKLASDGLFNMLDCVRALDDSLVSVDKQGNYSFDWTGDKLQKVADMLGMSTEAVQILEEAMQDAGFDVVFDSMYADVDKLNQAAKSGVDTLRDMWAKGGFETDLGSLTLDVSSVQEAETQIESVKGVIDEIKDANGGTFDISAEGATEALSVLTSLIRQREELQNPTIMSFDTETSNVDAATADVISKMQELKNLEIEIEANGTADLDTSEAESKAKALMDELEGNEILAKCGIEVNKDDFDATMQSIEDHEAEINAMVNVEGEDKLEDVINKAASKGGQDLNFNVNVEGGDKVEEIYNKAKDNVTINVEVTGQEQITEITDKLNDENTLNVDVQVTGADEISQVTQSLDGDNTLNVDVQVTGEDQVTQVIDAANNPINVPVTFEVTGGESIDAIINSANNPVNVPVTFTPESSQVEAYAATEKQGNGTVTWKNNSGVVDSYAATMKSGYGTVNWTNNTAAVKTYFTATGTVNWVNAGGPGKAQGTAYSVGSAHGYAFAQGKHGDWGMPTDGEALGGELGRK